ncbi:Uncharacterized protein SCF082_LOCUS15141 [Durusdinium trenchii]|uniref:EF-hand domain-containing protein n=1 Tax=Durusdinium trenchii TaxID=1381693 RepID=A0ABP0K3J1_9DINO
MASARLGRTNFAKCIVPTDPPILQHFKQLSNLRPMNVLAKSSASDASGFQLNQAVIIRKGRSTFQTVTKDYKEKIEAAMNQFKTNLGLLKDDQADGDAGTFVRDKMAYGGMLVVSADISEMAGFFGVNSIPNLLDSLKTMEIQNIPDALSLPSLSAGYMKVGDMLALPMGTLAITKVMSKPIMEYTLAAMPKVQSFQSAVPDGAVADDEQDEFEKELLEELEEHKALEQVPPPGFWEPTPIATPVPGQTPAAEAAPALTSAAEEAAKSKNNDVASAQETNPAAQQPEEPQHTASAAAKGATGSTDGDSEFPEHLKKYWPDLACPGSGYTVAELEWLYKQALTDLEITEESVHRILRVLFPSNPSSMARVGSSYRRQRGNKVLAFQNSAFSQSVPLLPSIGSEEKPSLRRSISSSIKPLKIGIEPKAEKVQVPSPRTALDQSLRRICPGADASQVKKMGDLLKRELTMRSAETSSEAHNGPRRQPLYTTPNAAGSKSMAKDTLSSSKLESSLAGEVWDSHEEKSDKPRVFHRMRNAAFLVSTSGESGDEIRLQEGGLSNLATWEVPSDNTLRHFRKYTALSTGRVPHALARHARISDLFRGCGVSWEKRLSFKAFSNLLEKLQIKCEEPRDAFDFLDVRSCGTISLREVVATLQNVMPGTKDWNAPAFGSATERRRRTCAHIWHHSIGR